MSTLTYQRAAETVALQPRAGQACRCIALYCAHGQVQVSAAKCERTVSVSVVAIGLTGCGGTGPLILTAAHWSFSNRSGCVGEQRSALPVVGTEPGLNSAHLIIVPTELARFPLFLLWSSVFWHRWFQRSMLPASIASKSAGVAVCVHRYTDMEG